MPIFFSDKEVQEINELMDKDNFGLLTFIIGDKIFSCFSRVEHRKTEFLANTNFMNILEKALRKLDSDLRREEFVIGLDKFIIHLLDDLDSGRVTIESVSLL